MQSLFGFPGYHRGNGPLRRGGASGSVSSGREVLRAGDTSHSQLLKPAWQHFFLSVEPCLTDPMWIQMAVGPSGPGPDSGGHSCVSWCVERIKGPTEGLASLWWWACVTSGSKPMSTFQMLVQPFQAPRIDQEPSEVGLMLRTVLVPVDSGLEHIQDLWVVLLVAAFSPHTKSWRDTSSFHGSLETFPLALISSQGFQGQVDTLNLQIKMYFSSVSLKTVEVLRGHWLQYYRLNSTSSPLFLSIPLVF